jgi:S-adenosylmethionine:tRNA ribosyltransferase-isomerase
LRVDALHYDLPVELIAQRPAERRELARLMHLSGQGGRPEHRRITDLPSLISPGSLVIINDTRVVPARLVGRKEGTGGRIEVLLLRRTGSRAIETTNGETTTAEIWRALGKSSKPIKFGTTVEIRPRVRATAGSGAEVEADVPAALFVQLLGRAEEDGCLEVALYTPAGTTIDAALLTCGRVPLPPYIRRADAAEDAERYQTVYARHDGAVAAPTAGLHLTETLLGELAARGCDVASITLHVGLGTFRPVQVDDFDLHPMHAEQYVVSEGAADAVARARSRGAPIVAIGTTTARALESCADPDQPGRILARSGETRLLIQPGYRWRIVDGLFTNFHLPSSTLLALVCAFAGPERVLDAYRLAVREAYRFFSYGDAMLLWRRD